MAQRMKVLNLGELSGVPKGANQGAFMVLAKAHTAGNAFTRFIEKIATALKGKGDAGLTPVEIATLAKEAESFNDVRNEQVLQNEMWRLQDALGTSISSIMCDDTLSAEDKRGAINASIAQFNTAVGNLPALQDAATADDGGVTKGDHDMKPEEVEAMIAKQLKPVADELALTKTAHAATLETVTAQAVTIETLKADNVALQKGVANQAVVAKATALVGTAPIAVEKVATLMGKLDAEGQVELEALIKQSAEFAGSAALFTAFGSPGRNLKKSDADAIQARADEIRKAAPTLTAEQAFSKALDENPAAYEAAMLGEG